jgi:hypothetical protein
VDRYPGVVSIALTRFRFGTCALLLLLGAQACLALPHRLSCQRGNVKAYGHRPAWSLTGSFDRIEIGTPEQPFRGEPALVLELPDGTRVRSDRLEPPALRARAERVVRDPRIWLEQEGWPAGLEEIALDGYRFLVRDERVVAIFAASQWYGREVMPPPALAPAEGGVFHRLPFDRGSLIAVLGEPEVCFEDLADLL